MCCKIFSVLKIQINMWNSQEDLSSQFEANPCITGPFLKRIRSGTASSNSIKMKNHNHETKKNVHQWLRLQEIFHRIKDCETNEEKYGLYLSKFFRLYTELWHNFHIFVWVWYSICWSLSFDKFFIKFLFSFVMLWCYKNLGSFGTSRTVVVRKNFGTWTSVVPSRPVRFTLVLPSERRS